MRSSALVLIALLASGCGNGSAPAPTGTVDEIAVAQRRAVADTDAAIREARQVPEPIAAK